MRSDKTFTDLNEYGFHGIRIHIHYGAWGVTSIVCARVKAFLHLVDKSSHLSHFFLHEVTIIRRRLFHTSLGFHFTEMFILKTQLYNTMGTVFNLPSPYLALMILDVKCRSDRRLKTFKFLFFHAYIFLY